MKTKTDLLRDVCECGECPIDPNLWECTRARMAAAAAKKVRPDVERLARAFARVLRDWLTPAELVEVNRRNVRHYLEGQSVCASHDFCDANMAMLAGWETAFPGKENDVGVAAHARLWGKAWDRAIVSRFWVEDPVERAGDLGRADARAAQERDAKEARRRLLQVATTEKVVEALERMGVHVPEHDPRPRPATTGPTAHRCAVCAAPVERDPATGKPSHLGASSHDWRVKKAVEVAAMRLNGATWKDVRFYDRGGSRTDHVRACALVRAWEKVWKTWEPRALRTFRDEYRATEAEARAAFEDDPTRLLRFGAPTR